MQRAFSSGSPCTEISRLPPRLQAACSPIRVSPRHGRGAAPSTCGSGQVCCAPTHPRQDSRQQASSRSRIGRGARPRTINTIPGRVPSPRDCRGARPCAPTHPRQDSRPRASSRSRIGRGARPWRSLRCLAVRLPLGTARDDPRHSWLRDSPRHRRGEASGSSDASPAQCPRREMRPGGASRATFRSPPMQGQDPLPGRAAHTAERGSAVACGPRRPPKSPGADREGRRGLPLRPRLAYGMRRGEPSSATLRRYAGPP